MTRTRARTTQARRDEKMVALGVQAQARVESAPAQVATPRRVAPVETPTNLKPAEQAHP
jgi:hypothetical protein